MSVVGLAVSAFALQHRETPGSGPLSALMFAASLWSFSEGMNLSLTAVEWKLAWVALKLVIAAVVAVTWLLFALEFTGNDRWVTPKVVAVLLLEPAAIGVAVLTNPGLFVSAAGTRAAGSVVVLVPQFGPLFYPHAIYTYLVIATGIGMILKVAIVADGVYRSQALALLVAAIVPVLGSLAYVFHVVYVDLAGIGLLFAGFVVTGTILRRQLFQLVPMTREIAREEIVANMDDKVIVLDDEDRIADLNPAAAGLLDRPKSAAIGVPVGELLPKVAEYLADADGDRLQAELPLVDQGRVHYYDVRVSPVERARGIVAGRLVSLREVTTQRQREQRLDVMNRLFRHNLRNEINVIKGNAELVADELADPTLGERVERIVDVAETISTRSDKVGWIARTLDRAELGTVDVTAAVADVVTDARENYPDAEIRADLTSGVRAEAAPPLSIAVEELVDNAVQHHDGEAPTVEISVERAAETVTIRVADDGPGIADHEIDALDQGTETALRHGSGLGLWLVNWTVEQFGGRLSFETTAEGCTAEIRLPRAGDPLPAEPAESTSTA
ncbi:MAG: histidine kinase N-terminal 7TM domain-containing protein [Haloarculaceae archaeon]